MRRARSRRWLLGGIVAAALLQTAALAKMVTDRAALLRDGREVVLETAAIDPRDLFRGHYTILNLEITRIPRPLVPIDADLAEGATIFVALAEGDDGFWRALSVTAAPPDADAPFIRGTFVYDGVDEVALRFPIDRYFAPQERALELEAIDRAGRMGVILALDAQGNGAIKGLMIDGARLYDPPLY